MTPLSPTDGGSRADRKHLESLLALLNEKERRQKYEKFFLYYPDTGPLRRELYPKHLTFFQAGAKLRERLALCANGTGKTEGMGGYELTCHLTGLYPQWWPGRRFLRPISAWAAGKTAETTRDIQQAKLLGPINDLGCGLLPKQCLGRKTSKSGTADAVDTIAVRHYASVEAFRAGESDGWSQLGFKAYKQGRGSFEGTEKEAIWLDEECPMSVYQECLIRGRTVGGMLFCTFTPLEGITDVVRHFLPHFNPGYEGPEVAEYELDQAAS